MTNKDITPRYFAAPDGRVEPTLWRSNGPDDEAPKALYTKFEMDQVDPILWPTLVRALSKPDTGGEGGDKSREPTHAEIREAILGPNGRLPATAAIAATRVQSLLRKRAGGEGGEPHHDETAHETVESLRRRIAKLDQQAAQAQYESQQLRLRLRDLQANEVPAANREIPQAGTASDVTPVVWRITAVPDCADTGMIGQRYTIDGGLWSWWADGIWIRSGWSGIDEMLALGYLFEAEPEGVSEVPAAVAVDQAAETEHHDETARLWRCDNGNLYRWSDVRTWEAYPIVDGQWIPSTHDGPEAMTRAGLTLVEVPAAVAVDTPRQDETAPKSRTLHVTANREIPEGHTDQRVHFEFESESWDGWLISVGTGLQYGEAYVMDDDGVRWVVMAKNLTPISEVPAAVAGEQR